MEIRDCIIPYSRFRRKILRRGVLIYYFINREGEENISSKSHPGEPENRQAAGQAGDTRK